MRFLRRMRDRLMKPEVPPKCACCDSRITLERVGPDRFFCAGCGKDFRAVKDARGDWTFDATPLRKLRRLSA